MLHEFRMPDAGEGLTEAEVLGWRVAVGDAVVVNQILLEVETAKAAVELPSPYAGVVMEVLAAPGEVVPVGQPIIRIEDGVEAPASSPAAAGDAGAGTAAPVPAARRIRAPRWAVPLPPGSLNEQRCSWATGSGRIRRPCAGLGGPRTGPTTSSPAHRVNGAALSAREAWSSGAHWRPDWAASRCAPSRPFVGWHATWTWTWPRSCPPGLTGRSPTTTSPGRPRQRAALRRRDGSRRVPRRCAPRAWPGARSCR